MRLAPLYRVQFTTEEAWSVELEGEHGREDQSFLLVRGRCEGRLQGALRAANYPRRRTDGVVMPDFRGVIDTEDGAAVAFSWHGYGTTAADGERRLTGAITHLAGDDRYRWLNEVVGVIGGRVEPRPDGRLEVTLQVDELVWEPI